MLLELWVNVPVAIFFPKEDWFEFGKGSFKFSGVLKRLLVRVQFPIRRGRNSRIQEIGFPLCRFASR